MKRALVTGCSRGIGRAVTEALLGQGWEVTGASRTTPSIRHPHFGWMWWDFSTRSEGGGDPLYHVFGDRDYIFDALIHCAGVRGPFGSFLTNDPEAWAQTIQTNLIGTARVVRAALPSLQRSDDGRILLFSGGGAFGPEPGFSAYAASKGGTISLMETLALELADTTVTVNAVAPGFIATDIHAGTPHEQRQADPDALGNVVECVRHLLSPQTRGLTGRTVSAQWDAWNEIAPWTMPYLGDQGTRTRHKIEHLRSQMIRRQRAI